MMKFDLYTKFILTMIAVALFVIAFKTSPMMVKAAGSDTVYVQDMDDLISGIQSHNNYMYKVTRSLDEIASDIDRIQQKMK